MKSMVGFVNKVFAHPVTAAVLAYVLMFDAIVSRNIWSLLLGAWFVGQYALSKRK